MAARVRSWWKQIKANRVTIQFIAIFMIIAIILILIGYQFDWTGFNTYTVSVKSNATSGTTLPTNIIVTIPSKTLYDWLQLLFIPIVLAIAGFWFNHRERKAAELRADNERRAAELRAEAEKEIEHHRSDTERDIAEDNQREAILKEYINKMSELLLHENLRESKQEHEVRTIARVQTLTTLSRLDNTRKVTILQFLYEAKLINKDICVIALEGADLYKINLSHVNLRGADLSGAILRRAILGGANLSDANLSKTDLWGADFTTAIGGFKDLSTIRSGEILVFDSADGGVMANLRGANLSEAILYGSNVTTKQLAQAQSLKGATMPDRSIHP